MWIDRAVRWLLPREDRFYDLLEQGSTCALNCAKLIQEACVSNSVSAREVIILKMAESEREADRVIHTVYDALIKTFVTPIDRSDISSLATRLENVTDSIHATSLQMAIHQMETLPPGSIELADNIVKACTEIHDAVALLRDLKKFNKIRAICKRINDLESLGDKIFRTNLGHMFKNEKDAITLLKNKEFLEGLEHTLDVCDDVANALETVVLKNA